MTATVVRSFASASMLPNTTIRNSVEMFEIAQHEKAGYCPE
jgi:hypothetical protein